MCTENQIDNLNKVRKFRTVAIKSVTRLYSLGVFSLALIEDNCPGVVELNSEKRRHLLIEYSLHCMSLSNGIRTSLDAVRENRYILKTHIIAFLYLLLLQPCYFQGLYWGAALVQITPFLYVYIDYTGERVFEFVIVNNIECQINI